MLKGKGIFVWKIRNCENGDVEKIALEAARAGFSHVLIKIADGPFAYNYLESGDLVPPLVAALRRRGISPWGWHYVRGDYPTSEARIAVKRVKELGLDGYVIDAEGEYKRKYSAAKNFMTLMRRDMPRNVLVALSSYRYPKVHGSLPWRQFLDKCDFVMPQVYWQASNNPAEQLQKSISQFKEIAPRLPLVPTGAAYTERGWTPTEAEITAFLNASKQNNLSAVNFWAWSAAKGAKRWNVVARYDYGNEPPAPEEPSPEPEPRPKPPPPPVEKDIAEKFVAALNTRNPDEMVKFYTDAAAHVSKLGTVQGLQEILVYYARFFVQVIPYATFTLTGFSGTGNSRHITWTAKGARSQIQNGNDTIGMVGGKIAYHYTYYSVTLKEYR